MKLYGLTKNQRNEACKLSNHLYHNGLNNKKRIPEGKQLVLPERHQILIEAGFPPEFREQLQNFFYAESLYQELAGKYENYCGERSGLPEEMKDKFETMAEKMSALEAKLETKENERRSKELEKVLDGLSSLYHTFKYIINYSTADDSDCDWEGKNATTRKRSFSNLYYRLYKWSQRRAALSIDEPSTPGW